MPFRAVGVETIMVEDAAEAVNDFDELQKIDEPCLLMVSEDVARECAYEIERFRAGKHRAVVAIGALGRKSGATLAAIRSMVARSLGVDLLGKK